MSAGLSTTITITFTPQLNEDINSVFPILSETGQIDIPLICTCKKALIEVEEPFIDFGDVIFGEQSTQYLKIKNNGALPTKIYVKTAEGRIIPFVSPEDLNAKEKRRIADREAIIEERRRAEIAALEEAKKAAEEAAAANEGEEEKANENLKQA